MRWEVSWRADPHARAFADRHYNRQAVGAQQFVPPGRCLVLTTPYAFWVTSWQEYVDHAWPGAWNCSAFRNEAGREHRSSELIREAVAATRWRFPRTPPRGMITFIDTTRVRPKRDPGRCYLRAGFRQVGTTGKGLLVLCLDPADMPDPEPPLGATLGLIEED